MEPYNDRSGLADTTELLCKLLADERIRMECGPMMMVAPRPLPSTTTWERVEGMLIGLAVGDALGNTSEGMAPGTRRQLIGDIRDYQPNMHAGGDTVGLPSDDTQLAFWTLESAIACRGLVPSRLAERFASERIYGIGGSMKSFLGTYKLTGDPLLSGPKSAGNGAIMRIAAVLVPHLRRPSRRLWSDAAINCMITHNDYAAISSSVAFVRVLWNLLRMDAVPEPTWWLDAFCETMGQLEGRSTYSSRQGAPLQACDTMSRFLRHCVSNALAQGMSTVQACNSWHSGAYLMETLPSVVYILCRHGHDPEEAIVRAVNDTWDNDTVAAIVGAAVGALHGKSALPQRWTRRLLGRTGASDDGRIFDLLNQAREVFWG